MPRYIKTEYNNKKKILKIFSCHLCPLMRIQEHDKTYRCRLFRMENGDNILKHSLNYIYGNDLRMDTNTFIPVPDWCKLVRDIKLIHTHEYLYKINKEFISVSIDNDFDLEVINTWDISYDVSKAQKYKPIEFSRTHDDCDVKTTTTSSGTSFMKKVYGYNNIEDVGYKEIKSSSNTNICSLCGEEDETVRRNKNNGTCSSCKEDIQKNQEKLYLSFINNFRIKRNQKVDFDDKFKVLEHIKLTKNG